MDGILETIGYYLRRMFNGTITRLVLSLLGGVLAYFFGDMNAALGAFFGLLFLDIMTGIWKSIIKKKGVSSEAALRGAVKITLYFVLISTGHLLEVAGLPLSRSVALFYAALTEGRSILENVEIIQPDLPLVSTLNKILEAKTNENS